MFKRSKKEMEEEPVNILFRATNKDGELSPDVQNLMELFKLEAESKGEPLTEIQAFEEVANYLAQKKKTNVFSSPQYIARHEAIHKLKHH